MHPRTAPGGAPAVRHAPRCEERWSEALCRGSPSLAWSRLASRLRTQSDHTHAQCLWCGRKLQSQCVGDPLSHPVQDVARCVSRLGHDGADEVACSVPTDEVHVANTCAQPGEQRGRRIVVQSGVLSRRLPDGDQDQDQRSHRPRCALSIDVEKVPERSFVEGPACRSTPICGVGRDDGLTARRLTFHTGRSTPLPRSGDPRHDSGPFR